MLYGCTQCQTEIENFQDSLAEHNQPLWDDAVSYSDGYTLETTFTFTNAVDGIDKKVGLCVHHEPSDRFTCWARDKLFTTDDYWYDLQSFYLDGIVITDGGTVPDLDA